MYLTGKFSVHVETISMKKYDEKNEINEPSNNTADDVLELIIRCFRAGRSTC